MKVVGSAKLDRCGTKRIGSRMQLTHHFLPPWLLLLVSVQCPVNETVYESDNGGNIS